MWIIFLFFVLVICADAIQSKRGLIVINYPQEQTDLTKYLGSPLLNWVYNYSPQPTGDANGYPYGNLSFVPMLWGQNNSDTFLSTVEASPNYDYVLGFNEPDMATSVGGSDIPVEAAVAIWQTQIEPLKNLGYKLGSPAGVLFLLLD
jgi:hypothetical protein